jgi:2-oxoisovalerate dehydrogenase E2 component (dihydrolipoyl transacylase)
MHHMIRGPVIRPRACNPFLPLARQFHASARWERTEKHVLSDIGEGVKEVQIIQWFVEEGAPIEEWSPLCEVQSDKASVEITSKYTGVIKKIYFGQDDVVQTGDTLLEIEVEGDAESEQPAEQEAGEAEHIAESDAVNDKTTAPAPEPEPEPKRPGKHASLATPAVRGLLKEHDLAIEDIIGTGKDGRVLKEDVFKHLEERSQQSMVGSTSSISKPAIDAKQTETAQKLTPVQSAMFKSMTGSLSIPHFLFSDSVDLTTLSSMRSRLNGLRNPDTTPKYSYMPFMIKAVSLALNQYPLLNARLDLTADPKKPQLILRSVHNIGVAMDTPNGLIVPVIKAVNARSITSIAEELQRLAQLGQAGKLSNNDLTGGTITVSNIGNIGGEVVAPVIVEGQLAIMGVGKIKKVPVFADDGITVKPALQASISWSADHRVVDGATMARVATKVQKYLEEPGTMIADMS